MARRLPHCALHRRLCSGRCCSRHCRLAYSRSILSGDFPKLGVPFWGSHTKDYSILGSILGSRYFGKLPSFCSGFWDGILNAWAICMDNPVLVREAFAAAVIPTRAASHASVVRRPDEGRVLQLLTTLMSACTAQFLGT